MKVHYEQSKWHHGIIYELEYVWSLCGREYVHMTINKKEVTCKKCLEKLTALNKAKKEDKE